jgi:site-specific recombinase XerD
MAGHNKGRKLPAEQWHNKGQKLPPEPLTQAEVNGLIGACSKRAPTGIRNRALIAVLYRAGLRVSEALALLPKDLDANASTIRVLHGKGDKSRVVGIDMGAWGLLQNWLDRRAALGINGRAPVFCTLDAKPMKAAYVRAMLPRMAKRADIAKRVHAHGLRHTFAFEVAGENTPLNVIQAQLGHSSLAVTDRYVRHLNPTAVVEAMKARQWII